jgi:hypothetical protein
MTAGQYYRIEFDASSDSPLQIETLVDGSDSPDQACFDKGIGTLPTWQTNDYYFQATKTTDSGWMAFYFGSSGQRRYALRNVSLIPVDKPGVTQDISSARALAAASGTPGPQSQDGAATAGSPGWTIELGGTAQAGQIYSATGVIVDIDRNDGNPADVELANEMVALDSAKTYVLHFRARAPLSPTIRVEAQDVMPGHPNVGLGTDVRLSPEWQDVNLTFTPANDLSQRGRLALMLGNVTGTVEFADVSIAEAGGENAVAYAPASSTAALGSPAPAGSLAPIASWDLDTAGSAVANVSPSNGGAEVDIDRADGTPAHILLAQDGVDLADGRTYELILKAKSSVARQVPVMGMVDGGATRLVGLNDTMHLTPEWQEFDLKFTAVQPVPLHSRIAFLLGGAASTVELSDVVLSATPSSAVTQTASAVVDP